MKIAKQALYYIDSQVNGTSFEIGGIMGSRDGEIITEIIMDNPKHKGYRCYYAPNVKFLNRCIKKWQNENVRFMGIFHTHFANIKTLSKADVNYINLIMNVIPKDMQILFFPVFILPNRELFCYKATKTSEYVFLGKEKLKIV